MITAALKTHGKLSLLHSQADALFVSLAMAHGAVLVLAPLAPVIALGVWWNSNTIAHNFIHQAFFRSRNLNRLFSLYLSLLLGIPQSFWRERHLAHHAGRKWKLRPSPNTAAEVLMVASLWAAFLALAPVFFLTAYLPGYAAGLALCALQGHYEHAHGTTNHHGKIYNFLFDGYHVEHHKYPGLHWSQLPDRAERGIRVSRWPSVLRWLDSFTLESLERLVLHSKCLQRFVLDRHRRAFTRLLAKLPSQAEWGL